MYKNPNLDILALPIPQRHLDMLPLPEQMYMFSMQIDVDVSSWAEGIQKKT